MLLFKPFSADTSYGPSPPGESTRSDYGSRSWSDRSLFASHGVIVPCPGTAAHGWRIRMVTCDAIWRAAPPS